MKTAEKLWLKHYPEDLASEINPPEISIQQMLINTVEKFPNNDAIAFAGTKMTYTELLHLAKNFASALQANGLKKGDRVAIMLPNCPQYVISYFGILMAGGIITQVNPMLLGKELSHLLEDSGSSAIVIYDQLLPALDKVIDNTSINTTIAVSFTGAQVADDKVSMFENFMKKSTGNIKEHEINPSEDVAVLQYTGGTTGRSKGAMLTHRNLLANVMQSAEFFKSRFTPGKDKSLTVLPLFHVFGMTSCMNLTIYNGGLNILVPRFEMEEFLNIIKEEKPTIFAGVPTMFNAIVHHPEASKIMKESINLWNSGSASLPVEILKEFEKQTNDMILEGYGLSEASPTTHCNPPFAERKAGSVGIAVPSTDCKIVDFETGTKEVPVGETGEIIVKGPQIMKGYWNRPEETATALRDGWLYTGDIAKMDEDGYLYIVDRTKDMIIASGYNVYPRDVEEVIYEHKAVQEAVVIGVPDDYRGETVKAIIVLKTGASATEDEIIAFCKENLAAYKVPTIVEFREELPKSAIGKILRRVIRDEELKKA